MGLTTPWIPVPDGGHTVWVSLAHVRQVMFTEEGGTPSALVWSGDDLWDVSDPATVAALRACVSGRPQSAPLG